MTEIFNNKFGTVRSDRVTYLRGKGIFAGGSEEDVPLKHVTSVRYDVHRPWIVGTILVLIGLGVAFGGGSAGLFIGGGLTTLLGAILLKGFPAVVVSTAGGDKERMSGLPWRKEEPQEFVNALKKQLFEETGGK